MYLPFEKKDMKQTFIDALERRRSYYDIGAAMTVSQSKIVEMVDRVMLSVPSAYNSQSSRLVILFGIHHICLWGIVKQTLEAMLTPERYLITREKIDNCFAAGCGTVLFYEDMSVVEQMKRDFPSYADKFDQYSEHTSAMHQLSVWIGLEELGLGATLQHYNPLIDDKVAEQWNINSSWRLIAQMPFGSPLSIPDTKSQHLPLNNRRLIFSE